MDNQTEKVIDEALEGQPRARELGEMIEALEIRRATFLRERDSSEPSRRVEWDKRLERVEKQIQTLREEQAIAGFVENSIRVAVSRPRMSDDFGDVD